MATDTAPARRQLRTGIQEIQRAIRLMRNAQPPSHRVVPSGTLGVLAMIRSAESADGCHGKDLAARGSLDPSTISRAVGALVRAGLVRRSADPNDGRASVLTLTPAGHDVLDEVLGWYDDRLGESVRDWSDADLDTLVRLLHRLTSDLIARFDDQPASDHPHTYLEAAR